QVARRELGELVERGYLDQEGYGKGTSYTLSPAWIPSEDPTPSLHHLPVEGVDGVEVEGVDGVEREARNNRGSRATTIARRDRVEKFVAEKGPVRVPSIAAALGTSTATIERHIAALRASGRIRFEGAPARG